MVSSVVRFEPTTSWSSSLTTRTRLLTWKISLKCIFRCKLFYQMILQHIFKNVFSGVDATSDDDVTSGQTLNVTLSPETDSIRARSTSTLSRVKDQVSKPFFDFNLAEKILFQVLLLMRHWTSKNKKSKIITLANYEKLQNVLCKVMEEPKGLPGAGLGDGKEVCKVRLKILSFLFK